MVWWAFRGGLVEVRWSLTGVLVVVQWSFSSSSGSVVIQKCLVEVVRWSFTGHLVMS